MSARVVMACTPGKDKPYSLMRGIAPICDDDGTELRWAHWWEAYDWCKANLGVSPFDGLSEDVQKKNEAYLEQQRNLAPEYRQAKLL